MLHMRVSGGEGGYKWRLIRFTPWGADVLASGTRTYEDEASCRGAVEALGRAAHEDVMLARLRDGHWRWQVADPTGVPLAESPPVFRDAGSCAEAFEELEHQVGAQHYW